MKFATDPPKHTHIIPQFRHFIFQISFIKEAPTHTHYYSSIYDILSTYVPKSEASVKSLRREVLFNAASLNLHYIFKQEGYIII